MNSNNFSLSIPQKLELYQVIAYLEEGEYSKSKERVEYLLQKAKDETQIDQARKSLLSKYSVDQILDAAAKQLEEKPQKDLAFDFDSEEKLRA
jgi:hypothetical protein